MKQNKVIIGITGGIGVGKTAVSKIFQDMGAFVIEVDKIAKQIVEKGQEAYTKIVDTFGKEILDENDNIDRKKLGDIVFRNENSLENLNKITHDILSDTVVEMANKSTHELVIIDSAIPFTIIFKEYCDEVWIIESDLDHRISRAMRRSNFTQKKVEEVIHVQDKKYDYYAVATKSIKNNSTLETLRNSVKNAYHEFKNNRNHIEG